MIAFLHDWWWALLIVALTTFIFAQFWLINVLVQRVEGFQAQARKYMLTNFQLNADLVALNHKRDDEELGFRDIIDSYEQDYHTLRENAYNAMWYEAHTMNAMWDQQKELYRNTVIAEFHRENCLPHV